VSAHDLLVHPQTAALGLMADLPHPLIPDLRLVDMPVTAMGGRGSLRLPPPLLGQGLVQERDGLLAAHPIRGSPQIEDLPVVEEAIEPDKLSTSDLDTRLQEARDAMERAEEGSEERARYERNVRRFEAFKEVAGS